MPLLRCCLTFIRELTTAVEGFLVNNIKHNLGIDIATSRTGAGFCIGIVGSLLEIGDGINGIAIKDRVATFVKQPQTVEKLIDIAGRLVDVNHNEFTLQCLLFEEVDNLLCICRRQTAGGLVEEKYCRLADELKGNVQTLALSAGDVFVNG